MRYYMLHKPGGCVSARKDAQDPTVMDYFPPELRQTLFPLGRLDKNCEGLLLITDDGKLNRRLLDPERHVQKEYFFWAAGALDDAACHAIRTGLRLKGLPEPTRPARLEPGETACLQDIAPLIFPGKRALLEEAPDAPAVCGRIWLTEGKRHQVKRMLEAVGCTVVYLRRDAFGPLRLDETLNPGCHRPLTEPEIAALYHAAGL